MNDLRQRLRALDDLDVPDVLARAERLGPRSPMPEPAVPLRRRIGAVVLALAIAAVGVLVVTRVFDGAGGEPAVRPSPVSPSPATSVESLIGPRDLFFLDIRTGRTTPLPRSLRAIIAADHFQGSPDGSSLAFDDGRDVYVASTDGTEIRRVAEGETPWWSPDGSRIVCVRHSNGFDSLVLVDIANGRSTTVFSTKREIYHPNFNADGHRILFTLVSAARGDVAGLWTIDANTGGRAVELPLPHSRHTHPAFGTYSPDGTAIAFRKTQYDGADITQMTHGAVWLADADGADVRQLGRDASWMSHIDPQRLWPMWSPDGRVIAFRRLFNFPITLLDAATGEPLEPPAAIERGGGADPTWLDERTLIVHRF